MQGKERIITAVAPIAPFGHWLRAAYDSCHPASTLSVTVIAYERCALRAKANSPSTLAGSPARMEATAKCRP
jgi:hypothetical protein